MYVGTHTITYYHWPPYTCLVQIQHRLDWCRDAKGKLSSYTAAKEPFQKWLTAAEVDKKRLKKVPLSRRKMKKYRDNMQQFHADVSAHVDELNTVQERGKTFVATAKVRTCDVIEAHC